MGFYDKYILPKLVHMACSLKPAADQREKVVPRARGTVLEIGIGSGLNLPFYNASDVSKVWGLEPSDEMRSKAEIAAREVDFEVEFVALPGEEVPLEDDSVDTVVMTYTLCTIPDPLVALRHMRRVLKPDGDLLFCEHGAAPDRSVRRWQDRINPFWCRFAGGCQLNRDIPALIRESGFEIVELDSTYIPGWRPASFNFWGVAR